MNSSLVPIDLELLSTGALRLQQHLDLLEVDHPRTHSFLLDSLRDNSRQVERLAARIETTAGHNDFDDDQRGKAYREGQVSQPAARDHGDRRFLKILEDSLGSFSAIQVGVDIIGGNGTTARTMNRLLPPQRRPYLISGDPCFDMVNDALAQGLPAIWQSAQESLISDGVLDFVIGSRGFHHIEIADRPLAFSEAFRVLRPGGVMAVLDFEEGTPTARWYSEGLHTLTRTGHDFRHFSREELLRLLETAGFVQASIIPVYDPFVAYAPTPEAARNGLLQHVTELFGMVKLRQATGENHDNFWARVDQTIAPWCTFAAAEAAVDPIALRRLAVFQDADRRWRAELPRIALCAVGVKN